MRMRLRLVLATVVAVRVISAVAAEPAVAEREQAEKPAVVETTALPYLTLMLVRDPAIHRELNLKADQVGRMKAAVAEVDNPLWRLRDVPVAQCQPKLDEHLAKLRSRMDDTLKADQIKRFDQLLLQARGIKALVSPEVVASLQLSQDQTNRIRAILTQPAAGTKAASTTTKSSKAARGGEPEKTQAQQVLEVLSPDQSQRLEQLTGTLFDLSQVRQVGCQAPELAGDGAWINAPPQTLGGLRGKVVAVHFWAFGCINCVHNLPHYQSWREKFSPAQLAIIGVHTPETEQERDVEKLRENVRQRGIAYPVVVDAANANWQAWGNHMWPSVYLVDKQGQVRYWWYGELNWQGAEGEAFMRQKIEDLIAEK